jgi:DMSO/TMAO reductase YedYZ heme-binding membrane subunit
MGVDLKVVLNNKAINGWRLFWLVSIPMSIFMIIAMMGADMSTGPGVSTMIQFSVRWAVPLIFLVVAASSVQILFPGPFPRWWVQNRKYIGLCFAVAMSWQGLFIFIMSYFFREYYYAEVYLLRDELEGTIGYIFLFAMVATSFQFGRKHLTPTQWKLLHRSAMYFLWAYPFSVYWWNLFYYENPQAIDYVYYWGGFLAFALRIAAWGKLRQQAAKRDAPESGTPLAFRVLGGALIGFGLFVSGSGLHWQKSVTAFMTAPNWSADLLLWLPFWPFEPYLSLFIIGLGAMVVTKARNIEIGAKPAVTHTGTAG